jgi:hypothetical protein
MLLPNRDELDDIIAHSHHLDTWIDIFSLDTEKGVELSGAAKRLALT